MWGLGHTESPASCSHHCARSLAASRFDTFNCPAVIYWAVWQVLERAKLVAVQGLSASQPCGHCALLGWAQMQQSIIGRTKNYLVVYLLALLGATLIFLLFSLLFFFSNSINTFWEMQKKVPVCKFVLVLILLCVRRVTEDNQSRAKYQRRLQRLFLYFICQSLLAVWCFSRLHLNRYSFKLGSPFCHWSFSFFSEPSKNQLLTFFPSWQKKCLPFSFLCV